MSRRKAGGFVDSPRAFAIAALSQLGRTGFTAGSAAQNVMMAAYGAVPEPILRRAVVRANDAVQQQGLKAEARRTSGGINASSSPPTRSKL